MVGALGIHSARRPGIWPDPELGVRERIWLVRDWGVGRQPEGHPLEKKRLLGWLIGVLPFPENRQAIGGAAGYA